MAQVRKDLEMDNQQINELREYVLKANPVFKNPRSTGIEYAHFVNIYVFANRSLSRQEALQNAQAKWSQFRSKTEPESVRDAIFKTTYT